MTENEKLRALLAEARTRLLQTFGYGLDIDGNLSSRIDAALAEPVAEESLYGIREDRDSLRVEIKRLERERDEARAEVERLRELAMHPTGVAWEQHHLNFKFMVRDELNATEAAAYQRGAEAMREAAANFACSWCGPRIRVLPIPEDDR